MTEHIVYGAAIQTLKWLLFVFVAGMVLGGLVTATWFMLFA